MLKKYWLPILLVLFTVSIFNLFARKSFTHQDLDYLRISTWNVRSIIFENFGDQLPLWFLLLKGYTAIFGDSQIALRVFSLIFVMISAVILSKLADIYNVNSFVVTALFLFNPLMLEDVFFPLKHWSCVVLMSLLTLYLFEKLKTSTHQALYIVLLILSIIIGLYTNFVYLLYLFSFSGYVVFCSVKRHIKGYHGLIISLGALGFAIPLVFRYTMAKRQLLDVQSSQISESVLAMSKVEYFLHTLKVISGVNYLSQFFAVILIVITILLIAIAIALDSKGRPTRVWLITTVLFTALCMTVLSTKTPIRWRYLGLTVPLLYLCVLPHKTNPFILQLGMSTGSDRRLLQIPQFFLQILLLSLTFAASMVMASQHNPPDWKGIGAFLKARVNNESQIILSFRWAGPFTLEYYLGRSVKRVRNLMDTSFITASDVWIVRRHGSDDRIYHKFYTHYAITTYDQFEDFRIIHLAREAPNEGSSLIKLTSLIEIEKNGKRKICQFRDGAINPDCYSYNWEKIRIRNMTAGGVSRLCLYVHPRTNTRISLFYKNIRLKNSLKFFTGIADRRVSDRYSPVYIDVFIDRKFVKRITQIDKKGWHEHYADTSDYFGRRSDVTLVVYSDHDVRRHFGFDAMVSEEEVANDLFFRNIPSATVAIDDQVCEFYRRDAIWPHNEKEPPFLDSKIFERWDCEENPVERKRIWNTVGKSYAVAGDEFREAIWMHPVFNKTKSVRYDNLNLSAKRIVGYYGISDRRLSQIKHAKLTFTVVMNGSVAFGDTFTPRKGWKEFSVPIVERIDSVEFTIATTNDRWNHFFFNAFIDEP